MSTQFGFLIQFAFQDFSAFGTSFSNFIRVNLRVVSMPWNGRIGRKHLQWIIHRIDSHIRCDDERRRFDCANYTKSSTTTDRRKWILVYFRPTQFIRILFFSIEIMTWIRYSQTWIKSQSQIYAHQKKRRRKKNGNGLIVCVCLDCDRTSPCACGCVSLWAVVDIVYWLHVTQLYPKILCIDEKWNNHVVSNAHKQFIRKLKLTTNERVTERKRRFSQKRRIQIGSNLHLPFKSSQKFVNI